MTSIDFMIGGLGLMCDAVPPMVDCEVPSEQ